MLEKVIILPSRKNTGPSTWDSVFHTDSFCINQVDPLRNSVVIIMCSQLLFFPVPTIYYME